MNQSPLVPSIVGAVSGRRPREELGLSAAFDAPAGEIETVVADMWAAVLNIDFVGRDDDFFDSGGDSLSATVLAGQIEERFVCKFPPAGFMSHPTIADQARLIRKLMESAPVTVLPGFVTVINQAGRNEPLFLLHGASGYFLINRLFFTILGAEQPVYVFQVPGLDGRDETPSTLEGLAQTYVDVIRRVSPSGAWRVGASCGASVILIEMCRLLMSGGGEVDKLVMIDPRDTPPSVLFKKKVARAEASKSARGRFKANLAKRLRKRKWTTAEQSFSIEEALLEKARQREERIRRENLGKLLAPGNETYQVQDILNATMTLRKALIDYYPQPLEAVNRPREVHMIVSTKRYGGHLRNPFWSNHLGEIRYHVVACPSHEEIFNSQLSTVARQLGDILDGTPP